MIWIFFSGKKIKYHDQFDHTGCPTISVKSETPLFSDKCWWIRLPISVLNKQCGGFDFLGKNFEISYLVRVRARYELSPLFRLSPLCSNFKFIFSVDIQFFGLKTTSHGKSDLKIWISEVRFTMCSGCQAKKLNTCRKHELEFAVNRAESENQAELVSGPDPDKKENFNFFFKKSNPPHCLFST